MPRLILPRLYCVATSLQLVDRLYYSSLSLTPSHLSLLPFFQWLLDRMPEFDKAYLPPSVSLKYGSMLDDNIAFSLMAFAVAPWSSRIPTSAKLGYILPYATFHEARTNWRPLFFARYFALVSNAKTTVEAIRILSEPGWTRATVNRYVNMTTLTYPSYNVEHLKYWMQWSSGSTPPIVAPADFMSYGYGSCTAHSTMMAYVARAVGIPARVVCIYVI